MPILIGYSLHTRGEVHYYTVIKRRGKRLISVMRTSEMQVNYSFSVLGEFVYKHLQISRNALLHCHQH